MEDNKIMTKEELDSITSQETVTLVDFYAEWCGPCRNLIPILDQLVSENTHINLVKIDVDANSALSAEFGIRSIPAVKIFKAGQEIGQFVGIKSKEDILKLVGND